jgi:hypothetical protein
LLAEGAERQLLNSMMSLRLMAAWRHACTWPRRKLCLVKCDFSWVEAGARSTAVFNSCRMSVAERRSPALGPKMVMLSVGRGWRAQGHR